MMERADFATQWLDRLGVKIYNKGQQILVHDGSEGYKGVGPLHTKIEVGSEFGDDEVNETWTYMFWPELDSLGYAVKLDTNIVKWKSRQVGAHRIIKKTRNSEGLSYSTYRNAASRTNMKIHHDPKNRRIRLLGDNVVAGPGWPRYSGVGPWITYDEDIPRGDRTRNGTSAFERLKGIEKEEDEEQYIDVKGIPMMLTDEMYIVCLPKQELPQRILVVGKSGMGKSLIVNALSGRIFYKWQDRVGWLIDPTNQLYNLSLPQDNREFNIMNSWIGEMPRPIPAVQFYLACRYKLNMVHPNISYIVTLDFFEFLKKYKFYTHGMKDYDVGASIRYINDFIKDFKNITSAQQIQRIMYSRIPGAEKDRGMGAMIYKYVNTFESIFKQRYTSNLYKGVTNETHELEAHLPDGEIIKGHPFIVAMEAGLVPVLNISVARQERFIRNYLADLMQKLVKHQASLPEEKKHRMWIIADELAEIYEEGKTRDNASAAFEQLFRQGRPNNIGFIGNTQSLDKLNKEMTKNATHIICVQIQEDTERRKIGKMFNLRPEVYEQLADLKKYEVMIFSKEPFIVYDRWGKKRHVTERGWYKGKLFPPLNFHYVPKGK